MNIIAVDDEPLVLNDLLRSLRVVRPVCEPHAFATSREALDHARQNRVDLAFLDIEMPGINGLSLAKQLKEIDPDTHIVFVTSYERYAIEAFALHATGYLLKPVRQESLARELDFVQARLPALANGRIEVRTFGGFEVIVDGGPLVFGRSKSKELLAYLVDKRGASATTREACATLWEDGEYTASRKSYYQTVVADLRATLAAAGASAMLVKSRNSLAIDPGAFSCDSYRFLEGDAAAVNSYRGDYLPSYSWAEFSVGRFQVPSRRT